MRLKISPLFLRQIKLFLLPVFTIMVVFILMSRFLLPKINETWEVFYKTKMDRDEFTLLETKARKLAELKGSSLLADFELMEFTLPSEKNIPLIFSLIRMLEKKNNVLVEGLALRPGSLAKGEDVQDKKAKAGTIENLDFSFSLVGSFDGVLNFMDHLEKSAPLFNIEGVSFSSAEGVFRATLTVTTFYQHLPESLGKIDVPLTELSDSQKKTISLVRNFAVVKDIGEDFVPESSPSGKTSETTGIFQL